MSTGRRKGATGLEWLLDETSRPDAAQAAQDEERARLDPVEAALAGLVPPGAEADSAAPRPPDPTEAWSVVPLQPIPEAPAASDAADAAALPSRGAMEANALDAVLGGGAPDAASGAPAPASSSARSDEAVSVSASPSPAPASSASAAPRPEITGEHELPPPRNLRRVARAVLEFDVRYRKGSEAVTGRGRNVGRDGMFVETNKFLPDGDVFTLQLAFGDPHNRRLSVIAEVAWSTGGNPDDPKKEPPGMGLKFLDVDDNDLPFLTSLAGRN